MSVQHPVKLFPFHIPGHTKTAATRPSKSYTICLLLLHCLVKLSTPSLDTLGICRKTSPLVFRWDFVISIRSSYLHISHHATTTYSHTGGTTMKVSFSIGHRDNYMVIILCLALIMPPQHVSRTGGTAIKFSLSKSLHHITYHESHIYTYLFLNSTSTSPTTIDTKSSMQSPPRTLAAMIPTLAANPPIS